MKRPADLRPIVDAYRNGKTQQELADSYGVSAASICKWLKFAGASGVQRSTEQRWKRKNLDRVSEMARMYRDGMTLREIGERFEVTRERVRQILARVGITSREGGVAVKADRRRRQHEIRRKRACIEKHGLTPAEYQALVQNGATRAYCRQRNNAERRGIGWEFNLATWWQVWQASGKWEQRGKGNGYVMARFNDRGPYAPGNVEIIHSVENILQYYEREKGSDCSETRAKWGLNSEAAA